MERLCESIEKNSNIQLESVFILKPKKQSDQSFSFQVTCYCEGFLLFIESWQLIYNLFAIQLIFKRFTRIR